MAILTGTLSVRRFRVLGDVPDGFRDAYREQLNRFAFREPPHAIGREEIEGWVQVHNLLDTSFDDFNRWLYEPYLLFALRVDKKTLPARLVRAMLVKRCEAWCAERGVERCPASVRSELKDQLEDELLARTLPRVALTEACWNLTAGYLVLGTGSESTIDRFRKRFFQTFGLRLVAWSPLDWLGTSDQVEAMLSLPPSALSPEVV